MTKKITALAIVAASVIVLSYSLPVYAPGPPKICEFIDDTNCSIEFSWLASDASSDPNNLVIVNGFFSRQGLVSDTTTDVEGQVSGSLVGTLKTISENSVSSSSGGTTITTTVVAQSRNVNHLTGVVTIDGVPYGLEIKTPGYESTQLGVTETFESPTSSQSLNQAKLTIPVITTMCSDETCYQGFGTIRRASSQTTLGTTSITFASDALEAEVIGENGLFQLTMFKTSRIVVNPP